MRRMRRFAVPTLGLAVALSVTGLVGGLPARGSAQDASQATPVGARTRTEAEARAPEADAAGVTVEVLGRTETLQRERNRHLTLFHISLEPNQEVAAENYLSAQVFAVESGSIVLTVSEVDPATTGTIVQRQAGEPCAAGCDLQGQGIVNREFVLNPGDSISHDGRVRYAYRDAGQVGRAGFTAAGAQGGAKAARACASGCG